MPDPTALLRWVTSFWSCWSAAGRTHRPAAGRDRRSVRRRPRAYLLAHGHPDRIGLEPAADSGVDHSSVSPPLPSPCVHAILSPTSPLPSRVCIAQLAGNPCPASSKPPDPRLALRAGRTAHRSAVDCKIWPVTGGSPWWAGCCSCRWDGGSLMRSSSRARHGRRRPVPVRGPAPCQGLKWASLAAGAVVSSVGRPGLIPGGPLSATPGPRVPSTGHFLPLSGGWLLPALPGQRRRLWRRDGAITSHRAYRASAPDSMAEWRSHRRFAFAAAHFIAMFSWSNLDAHPAIHGAEALRSSGLPIHSAPAYSQQLLTAALDLFIGSASASGRPWPRFWC